MRRRFLMAEEFDFQLLLLRFDIGAHHNLLWTAHPLANRSGWMTCSHALVETCFGRWEAKIVALIDDYGEPIPARHAEWLMAKQFSSSDEFHETPPTELNEVSDGLRDAFIAQCRAKQMDLIEEREEMIFLHHLKLEARTAQAAAQGERTLVRLRRQIRSGELDANAATEARETAMRLDEALNEAVRDVRVQLTSLRASAAEFEAEVIAALPNEIEFEHLWTARWTTVPRWRGSDASDLSSLYALDALARELRDELHWFGIVGRRTRARRATQKIVLPTENTPERSRRYAIRDLKRADNERRRARHRDTLQSERVARQALATRLAQESIKRDLNARIEAELISARKAEDRYKAGHEQLEEKRREEVWKRQTSEEIEQQMLEGRKVFLELYIQKRPTLIIEASATEGGFQKTKPLQTARQFPTAKQERKNRDHAGSEEFQVYLDKSREKSLRQRAKSQAYRARKEAERAPAANVANTKTETQEAQIRACWRTEFSAEQARREAAGVATAEVLQFALEEQRQRAGIASHRGEEDEADIRRQALERDTKEAR